MKTTRRSSQANRGQKSKNDTHLNLADTSFTNLASNNERQEDLQGMRINSVYKLIGGASGFVDYSPKPE